LAAALSALRLSSPATRLVAIPVNDNPYADAAAGGSHWSTLLFKRPGSEGAGGAGARVPDGFSHWDSASSGGGNGAVAERMAAALAPIVGAGSASVVQVPTPQQRNGSDCGVYALWYAGAAASAVLAGEDGPITLATDTSAGGKAAAADAVAALRRRMRDTAVELGLPVLRS
jgi:sentrin-specific protease 8